MPLVEAVRLAGGRVLGRALRLLEIASLPAAYNVPLAVMSSACIALHWRPTRDDGRLLAALYAEDRLRKLSDFRAQLAEIGRCVDGAGAVVATAGLDSQGAFPDNSRYSAESLMKNLPAIADAVRAGDMSTRELAALLVIAAQRGTTAG